MALMGHTAPLAMTPASYPSFVTLVTNQFTAGDYSDIVSKQVHRAESHLCLINGASLWRGGWNLSVARQ